MARSRSHYWKVQTKWTRIPAVIEASLCDDAVAVRVIPERAAGSPPRDPATIFLTPQEAQGFAAWLSEQAEHLTAKKARAEARRAERLAKKGGIS